MSGTTIHKQARTTPQLREEIRNSSLSERALAEKYNVSRSTVRKWRYWETAAAKPPPASTAYGAVTGAGAIVVELRLSWLLLSIDGLLVLVREFIQPGLNRSMLRRLLVRREVSNIWHVVPQPEAEAETEDLQELPARVPPRGHQVLAGDGRLGQPNLSVCRHRPRHPVGLMERHQGELPEGRHVFLKNLQENAPFHLAHPAHQQRPGLHGPVYPKKLAGGAL